jgi:hypothetical protein
MRRQPLGPHAFPGRQNPSGDFQRSASPDQGWPNTVAGPRRLFTGFPLECPTWAPENARLLSDVPIAVKHDKPQADVARIVWKGRDEAANFWPY